MEKIVVFSGSGISAESGISTFRDQGGLWEQHDIMEVASPQGFEANPGLVLEFYNQRRRQLSEVEPNAAHYALAELEAQFDVEIVTQNVDDLHERAGSTKVTHLHGELIKVRSCGNASDIKVQRGDVNLGDCCAEGHQLRPHIVWFGEAVPEMERAIDIVAQADILIVVGTSLEVYPAASLVHYTDKGCKNYLVDPNSNLSIPGWTFIYERASVGVPQLVKHLNLSNFND